MSALGHKRTCAPQKVMSALSPKADIPLQLCKIEASYRWAIALNFQNVFEVPEYPQKFCEGWRVQKFCEGGLQTIQATNFGPAPIESSRAINSATDGRSIRFDVGVVTNHRNNVVLNCFVTFHILCYFVPCRTQ